MIQPKGGWSHGEGNGDNADGGLKLIDLNFKISNRTDQYGNQFKYRAKVKDTHDAQLGRWAWDVFLMSTEAP